MIKVSKDLNDVPASLNDRKTNRKRDNCIKDRKYHYKKAFDQQYKQQDVKDELKRIYNEKCTFCEEKVKECIDNNLEDCSQTIEHYRPKGKYYWLAYSWDNLLLCCHRCNQNKDNHFEIDNTQLEYNESFKDKIHTSTNDYQDEKPKIINPELESVIDKLSFYDGIIYSDDKRVKYTIKTCSLDRYKLNEERKIIIDDFIKVVIDKKLKNEPFTEDLRKLMNEFKNQKSEFRALRYWIFKNYKLLID